MKGGDRSMARVSLFNSPLMLGFEHFEDIVDQIAKKSADGYPPYNIEQIANGKLRITLAVAGFSEDDLLVEVQNSQLEISGRHSQSREDDGVFLHRGIAARQFRRTFVLADGIEVVAAELNHGLLNIDLERPEPAMHVRKVEIKTRGKAGTGQMYVGEDVRRAQNKVVE
jgi:HSP20 family molecular chaperone IbpA